jgi:hypothetical protein
VLFFVHTFFPIGFFDGVFSEAHMYIRVVKGDHRN